MKQCLYYITISHLKDKIYSLHFLKTKVDISPIKNITSQPKLIILNLVWCDISLWWLMLANFS